MHTMLRVVDMDRTLAFYCGHLGMTIAIDRRDPDGYRNVFVGCGVATGGPVLEFGARPGLMPNTGSEGFDHIALETTDVQDLCERLRAAGVVIQRDVKRAQSGALIAIIEDPDGYRIELIQPNPQASPERPAPVVQPRSSGRSRG